MNNHSHIAQASKVVSEKLGLYFPENRYQDLSAGLHEASKELGFEEDGTTFISLLIEQKLSNKQLDILAEKLTIGETYFFREKQILTAFREMIIPSLVKKREFTTRSIRIWSAGCCSGEEPYTLAMILSEIIPDIASWNISILATDINRRFLDKAASGKYTPWSFRETPVETKKRYFTPAGREFEISPDIRNMVNFKHLNLVNDPFPSERSNTNSMDVIFCRNVLMYFAPETARAVGEKFYHSLTDEGWFITSQVELSDELFHLLGKVNYKDSFLYRKTEKKVDLPKKLQLTETKRSKAFSTSSIKHQNGNLKPVVQVKTPESVKKSPKATEDPVTDLMELTRSFANQGDLKNALRWSDKLIDTDRSNPEGYYLQGMILFEQGELIEAEKQLKRALYLDPDHLLSHFQMATLCLRSGKEKQARKHKQNVIDLLQKFQDDTFIPGTEGMTAGHLRGLLQPINILEHE